MCHTDTPCDFTRPAATVAETSNAGFGPVYRVLRRDEIGAKARCMAAGLSWGEARRLCDSLNARIGTQFPRLTMARPICSIERALPTIQRGAPAAVGDLAILKLASEPRRLAGGAEVWREWFEVGRVADLKPLRVLNGSGAPMGQGRVVGHLSAKEIEPGLAMQILAQRAAAAVKFGGEFSNLQAIAHAVAPALRPGERWVSETHARHASLVTWGVAVRPDSSVP